MTKPKAYSEIIRAAIDAVENIEEPYRTLAFSPILNDLISAEAMPTRPDSPPGRAPAEHTHSPMPFAELSAAVKPTDNYEKILAAIYHLEQIDGKSPVTRSEVDAKLWEVREKVGSTHVYLRNLVGTEKAMLVTEKKDGKDAYRMLRKAIDFIERRLDADSPKTTLASGSRDL